MDESVAQFVAVTQASAEEARFYCEASGGDVGAAIAAFYEAGAGPPGAAAAMPAGAGAAGAGAAPPSFLSRHDGGGPRRGTGPPPPPPPRPSAASAAGGGGTGAGKKKQRKVGGIATLSSLRDDSGDEEDERDKPNEYYAGGAQSTLGGPRGGGQGGGGDPVGMLFDRAREHGAVEGSGEHPGAAGPSRGGGRGGSSFAAFSGSGRRMDGSTPEPAAAGKPAAAEGEGGEEIAAEAHHRVTFWSNGFTVDDGPLRSVDDPAEQPFLGSIMRGEVPRELVPAHPSTQVHISLMKRVHEAYEAPPAPKHTAFSGEKKTLRSEASPEVVAAAAAASSASASAAPGFKPVDPDRPTTSLQIRLADGTRMVARFNLDHTVSDVRAFVNQSRPGPPPSYVLMMLMPRTIFTDESQTLDAAGLVNAVVIQSLV